MKELIQALLAIDLNGKVRTDLAPAIVETINEGEVDALKMHSQLKCFEDILTRLTDTKKYPILAGAYRKAIIDAAGAYGKSFELYAGKFETKEAGVKYDYSLCNDPEMAALHIQQKALDAAVKEREKFLQTVSIKGLIVTNEETGETNIIYPPARTSTTTLQLTLK
jgi:hypothetical protein